MTGLPSNAKTESGVRWWPLAIALWAFGWTEVLERQSRLALLIYASSLTPLLRIVNGDQGLNRWDVVLPIGVVTGLLWLSTKRLKVNGDKLR